MDRTLVICKPDAVERGLVGEIISRFERKGLHLVAVELRHLDEEVLSVHYEEHLEKRFMETWCLSCQVSSGGYGRRGT